MKRTQKTPSWHLSDAFWQKVEPLISAPRRDPKREYARKPGAGRTPLPPRQVFAGIVYMLRTGTQWKAWPKEQFGSASAIHRHVLRWQAAGFFERLWLAGLVEYDDLAGIAWTWQRIDGSLSNAPLAQDAVGPNPTDIGLCHHLLASDHPYLGISSKRDRHSCLPRLRQECLRPRFLQII